MPTVPEAVLIYRRTCIKCGYSWPSQKPTTRQCPQCGTRRWDGPIEHLPFDGSKGRATL